MKILSLVLCLFGVSVFGQTTTGTTNHYEVLKQERMFCISGGFAGTMMPAGHSLLAVAKQKDAATVFTKLTREDSPSAQLFGLLGLQMVGSDQFNNALAKLAKNKSPVTVLNGCIAMQQDVASVAQEIKQGRWSLGLPVKEAK